MHPRPPIIPVPSRLRARQRRAVTATAMVLLGGFAGVLGVAGVTHPVYRPGVAAVGVDQRIDVNSADAATLCLLPGVGPAIARRIIAHRTENGPFHNAAQLEQVKMIGSKTRRKLEPWVRFGPVQRETAGGAGDQATRR